ncbi:hypothetical protein HO173_009536 [Letharia columbiana]|uniref:Ankyrin repeat protein n=1 Tax=Letharia columbiana TaxID=112416 RepID=A0A8H6FP73_9LECA|nr:uncharacterized protein HO173_009536 [Letharia columbiana]KAF6232153.1 hypothetical protein HO173_009536 [Letharia columbiana]
MLLRSIVVDYLEQEHRREKTGVAYVFCMHNGANQTASNYLGSSLRQLARQNAAILEDIKSCHRHHTRYETRPSLDEFAKLLRLQVEKFDEVFIVIDALDECPEHDQVRKSFLAEVRALLPKVSLMVTSRDVPSIENMFKHDIRLEIRARDQDIRGFIKSQMEQRDGLVELLEGHSDVQSTIIATVLEKTNGMFLIAALHMDSLAKEDNIRELKESLQRLPMDLDKTYDDALERIKQQDSRKLARADQVLTLISCAKRPLKLEEMRQALSIRRDDTFLDPEALPRGESFISTCCGLVVVEDESQIVRLVHYTTEEYFKRKVQRYRSPEAHGHFASILVTYLSFTTFTTFSLDTIVKDAMNEAAARDANIPMTWSEEHSAVTRYMEGLFESNVLVQYAAENWGRHTHDAFTNTRDNPDSCLTTTDPHNIEVENLLSLKQLIRDFLEKEHNTACANEVFHHVKKQLHNLNLGREFRGPTNVTNLHIVASFGIQYFVEYYLDQGAEIDARDSFGMTALHKAAENGHVEVVRLLLDSGATIGIRDQWEFSALARAIAKNHVSVSRLLLQNGSDPGFVRDHRHSTISIAADRGHEECLVLLAECRTDDVRKNELMRDTLYDAASCGREGIVRLLVRGGKNWNIPREYVARAMTKAASQGQITIMKVLLEAGVDVSSPLSLAGESLQEAAMRGRSEATELLLTAGANPNRKTDGGDLPLHAAAQNGHVGTVALLLENGAEVNALNSKGETALLVIAGPRYGFLARSTSSPEGSVLVMQQLLDKGANTAVTERQTNRTSLECAILRGYERLVRLLIQYESLSASQKVLMLYLTRLYHEMGGMSKNDEAVNRLLCETEAQDLGSISELLLITVPAEKGYKSVILKFLQSGAAIEAKDFHGNTALQLSAWEGHNAVVELLLHHKADINSRGPLGGSTDATPLMMAASKGRTDVVRFLLDQGADIDAASTNRDFGSTAVAQALYGDHTATAKALLERGADANARYNRYSEGTLLHAVARNSNWQSQIPNMDLLLENGADLEAKDSNGQTLLAVRVQYENLETVQYLLERGADLEAKDRRGQTPLSVAVQKGTRETVNLLLEEGADLETKDNHAQTPLMVAVQKGSPQTVNLLLEEGANLEARDNNGHTPLVMAVRSGRFENVELLLERGADPEPLSPSVTAENDDVNKWDFNRAVQLVMEARSKTT